MRQKDDPWHPMTDPRSVKTLGKLIEESGELASAAARCVIQGIGGVEPDTGKPNIVWLEDEIADVLANIKLTIDQFGLNADRIEERTERKKTKLRVWHDQA